MGQSPARLNVGVGTAEEIEKLTIRWPNGKTQVFQNVPVDCEITLDEGAENYQINRNGPQN